MKNEKYIEDFILGKKLSNYDELTNDKEFMLAVLEKTMDKKYYYLCSNELRMDAIFIKKLCDLFHYDVWFEKEIIDYYFDNIDNIYLKEESFELAIIGSYNIQGSFKYLSIRHDISKFYERLIKSINLDFSQKPLSFSKISYFKSDIIKNYYAKDILMSLIKYYKISIVDVLHDYFDTAEEVSKIDIYAFINDYIKQYDFDLAEYLKTNERIVKFCFYLDFEYILKTWETYEYNEKRRYNLLFQSVIKQFNEAYDMGDSMDSILLLGYVSVQYGFMNEFFEYFKFTKYSDKRIFLRNMLAKNFEVLIDEDSKTKQHFNIIVKMMEKYLHVCFNKRNEETVDSSFIEKEEYETSNMTIGDFLCNRSDRISEDLESILLIKNKNDFKK